MRVGELLEPVVAAMRQDLLRASYLQADETIVPVQMHDKRGADHQAYLWQYGKPGGETVFDFRLGRGREGPQKFLGQWEGILQTDGYQAYDGIGGPKLVHVGCWAHARRKFVDAVKVNRGRCRGRPDGDAHGRVVPGGPRRAAEADDGRGAAGVAAAARRGVGGRDSAGMREAVDDACCRRARWARRSATR